MQEATRAAIAEGRIELPRIGAVVAGPGAWLPFVVVDGAQVEVGPVVSYLRLLMVGDASPLTSRSYAHDLLRWYRLLWAVQTDWQNATEAEVVLLVSWMRHAPNPQRRRRRSDTPPAGSVNLKTGKPSLGEGYAPQTINHRLTVISNFYAHHARQGHGPLLNPVPAATAQRSALAHRSSLEARPAFRRGRLRQRVPATAPRSIPDAAWDELFAAMTNHRDRALLACYVSSGARACELLGIIMGDVDWANQRLYVISKGSRLREPVPASPEAFMLLAVYLDAAGLPEPDQPVWRTLDGEARPVSYWTIRRAMQRANAKLGTNWTLHDLRHTTAARMSRSGALSLPEIQVLMRHRDIAVTSGYLNPRLEDLVTALAAHYATPRKTPSQGPAMGYDPADLAVVFGD